MNGFEEFLLDFGRWILLLEFFFLVFVLLEFLGFFLNFLKLIFLVCLYTFFVVVVVSVGGYFLKWMRNLKNLILCKIYYCIN